jgi:hypothetical protein
MFMLNNFLSITFWLLLCCRVVDSITTLDEQSTNHTIHQQRKLSSSASSFLAQALLLSPPKLPQARVARSNSHSVSDFDKMTSSSSYVSKKSRKGKVRGSKESRQASITTAQHIGGELMTKLINGLRAVDGMINELKGRLLLTQSSNDGYDAYNSNGDKFHDKEGDRPSEEELHDMFNTAIEQGMAFQDDEIGRNALIEKLVRFICIYFIRVL